MACCAGEFLSFVYFDSLLLTASILCLASFFSTCIWLVVERFVADGHPTTEAKPVPSGLGDGHPQWTARVMHCPSLAICLALYDGTRGALHCTHDMQARLATVHAVPCRMSLAKDSAGAVRPTPSSPPGYRDLITRPHDSTEYHVPNLLMHVHDAMSTQAGPVQLHQAAAARGRAADTSAGTGHGTGALTGIFPAGNRHASKHIRRA